MSIDLSWHLLDNELADHVRTFLNKAFSKTPLPDFLGPVTVTNFSFGDVDPNVELIDIRDVFPGFTEEEETSDPLLTSTNVNLNAAMMLNGAPNEQYLAQRFMQRGYQTPLHAPPSTPRRRSLTPIRPLLSETKPPAPSSGPPLPSVQFHVRVAYSGNLRISLKTSLLVNYPSPLFMSLPLSLAITGLAFDGVFVIAYEGEQRKLHVSCLEPGSDEDGSEIGNNSEMGRICDRLLSELVMESEVGQADKHVLKNVGKVEKFVLEVARSALESELIYPAFQTIAF